MTDEKRDDIDKALAEAGILNYRSVIRAAAARTGIGAHGRRGDPARLYVVRLMLYYLGKAGVAITPRELSTVDLERWAKRRAWDELEKDVARLPALRLDREPITTVDELNARRATAGTGHLPPAA